MHSLKIFEAAQIFSDKTNIERWSANVFWNFNGG